MSSEKWWPFCFCLSVLMCWIHFRKHKHICISLHSLTMKYYIDCSVQDCSIPMANTLEILQSCTKPLTCGWNHQYRLIAETQSQRRQAHHLSQKVSIMAADDLATSGAKASAVTYPILQSQYHGCWWPGDIRSQGISSNIPYLTKSVSWLLMTWLHHWPGHQQSCYWPCSTDIIQSRHQKD